MIHPKGAEKKCFGWGTSATDEEYRRFLAAYLEALSAHLDALGIKENCFFHVTDEPRAKHIPHYSELSAFVKKHAGGIGVMDAVSHYDCLAGGMDLPVVAMNSEDLNKFLALDKKFIYYCVTVDTKFVPNRYVDMPTQRSEVLGCMLYQTGAEGFLHWGYNYYNNRASGDTINPYLDLAGEDWVAAGDTFVVYPDFDGTPLESLRMMTYEEIITDYRAMRLAESLTSHDTVVSAMESALGDTITFSRCARTEAEILAVREAVNNIIKSNICK